MLEKVAIPAKQRGAEDQLRLGLAKRPPHSGSGPGPLLHRAAWALSRKDPRADALVEWTRNHLRARLGKPEFRAALSGFVQDLAKSAVEESLHDWIRSEARRALDSK